MGDYTPVYIQGQIITLTASAACKGGDLLAVTGVNSAAPITPNAVPYLNMVGVASSDAPVNGRVSFYCRGPVHESVADGTITAGDQVCTAANTLRQVRTLTAAPTTADVGAAFAQAAINTAINADGAAVNAARGVLGVALTSATDGNKVRWMQF